MIDAVIFDLDDTLYRESDFVASGYREVALYVSRRCGDAAAEIHGRMMTVFWTEGRRRVFPRLLERYPDASLAVQDLADVYRGHTPDIRLYPGCLALLRTLRSSHRLGIVTDGLPEVQRRKVRALGLGEAVDGIVYTWDHGSEKEKPHPLAFRLALDLLKAEPSRAVFVGDHPQKDVAGARSAGMLTVQLFPPATSRRRGAGGDGPRGDFAVETLQQLPGALAQLEEILRARVCSEDGSGDWDRELERGCSSPASGNLRYKAG